MILGIDPATHGLGWALIDGDGRVSDCGYRSLPDDGWLEHRVRDVLAQTDERNELEITNIVVERVGGGRGVQSMLRVADVAGIVAGCAAARWPLASMWRPTPSEWKRGAGLKGNANKDAVRELSTSLLPWGWDGEYRQDTHDAVAMAYAEWNLTAGDEGNR